MATQYSFGKIVTDGLVLCLDAADRNSYVSGSTTWRDVAGSNNGTLTNGPTFNSSNGGSIVFDGTNDAVICTDNTTNNITSNTITLSAWIKPNNVISYKQIFARASGTGTTQRQYGLYIVGAAGAGAVNSLGFEIRTTSGVVDRGYGSIVSDVWQYVTGVYNGTNMYWYINGVQIQFFSQSGNIITQSSNLYIGQFSSGGFSTFNGNIASAQMYNRALSAQEVLQNYNAQKSRFGLS
jgi:hypothetical protein